MMPDQFNSNDAQDPSVMPLQNGIEIEIPSDILQRAIANITPINLNLEPAFNVDLPLELVHFNIDEWAPNLQSIANLKPIELAPQEIFLFYHLLSTYPNETTENCQNFPPHVWLLIFAALSVRDLAHLMVSCKRIANLMAADETTQKRFYDSKFSIFHPKPSERLLDHFRFNDLAPLPMRLRIPTVVDETDIYEQPGDGTNGFTFRKT